MKTENLNKMNKAELTVILADLLGEPVAGKWTKAALITGIENERADQAAPKSDNEKHAAAIAKQIKAIKSSFALDREVQCLDDREIYANVNQAWKSGNYDETVTVSMFDDMSNKLYSAAKRGERVQVTKGGFTFELTTIALVAQS